MARLSGRGAAAQLAADAMHLLDKAGFFEHIHVELKVAVARAAYGREGAKDTEAHGAHIAGVDQLAVTEAGGTKVHLDLWRIDEHLTSGALGQEEPQQVAEQTAALWHLEIETTSQIARLLHQRRVVA